MDVIKHKLALVNTEYDAVETMINDWGQFLMRAKKYKQQFSQYVQKLKPNIQARLETIDNLKQTADGAKIDANKKIIQVKILNVKNPPPLQSIIFLVEIGS